MNNYKVKIYPLTPVHIGSDDVLVKGIDFIEHKGDIYILDINKIGKKLGDKNIPKLTKAILNDTLKQLFEDFDIKVKSVSKRIIDNWGCRFQARDNKLRAMMTDAMGRPYIPGSSIKGALRTAVLATLAREDKNQQKLNNENIASIEKSKFGNIQSDWWRFVHVGDAVFKKSDLMADTIIRMTRDRKTDSVDHNNVKQFVEALNNDNETESSFTLGIDLDGYKRAKEFFSPMPPMPSRVQAIEDLCKLVNVHTRCLLQEENDLWENVDGSHNYISQINDQIAAIDECGSHSCVLRLGFGSGWRFITGAWSEGFKYPQDQPARMGSKPGDPIRPPITRSVDDEQDGGEYVDNILGFVKLVFEP